MILTTGTAVVIHVLGHRINTPDGIVELNIKSDPIPAP